FHIATNPHRVLHSFPTRRSSDLSIVRPAPTAARLPGAPIATIFSPATPISAGSAPVGSTAVPPETIRSNIAPLPLSLRASEIARSEEHTSGLQSLAYLVCRLLLE